VAVDEARAALVAAEGKLAAVRGRRRILCSCGKQHAIRELGLIVTHWYVEPYSCAGGDYWREGEWQFLCPVDGMRNRFLFDDYGVDHEKRGIVGVAAEPTFKSIYRRLFVSSISTYETDCPYPFYNNYYVDRHRERFELPTKIERLYGV
jgi:hypothetical protein